MMRASGTACILRAGAVPFLPGAAELVAAGHVPGGTRRNLADLAEDVVWQAGISDVVRTLLADAQTSGGLLLCVPPDRAEALVAALQEKAPAAAVIGEVVDGPPGRITVT